MAKGAGRVGCLYIGVPSFYETFFGNVVEIVLKICF
jgi:hypothetical protein